METAAVRLSMPGGVGGQRREPLTTQLAQEYAQIPAPEPECQPVQKDFSRRKCKTVKIKA